VATLAPAIAIAVAAAVSGCQGEPAAAPAATAASVDDAAGGQVDAGHKRAAPDPDKPEIAISAPAAGAEVDGDVVLRAAPKVASGLEVAQLRFEVDGQPVAALDEPPWQHTWDSAAAGDGAHTIAATVVDNLGRQARAEVQVVIDRKGPDIAFKAPAADTVLAGDDKAIAIELEVSDTASTVAVSALKGDDISVIGTLSAAPWKLQWAAAKEAGGVWLLRAIAKDSKGRSRTALRHIVIDRPPELTIVAPKAGATVAGTVDVEVKVSDDVGPGLVRLDVDGIVFASEVPTDKVATIKAKWSSEGVAAGKHKLTARAKDSRGAESTVSTDIHVDQPASAKLLLCPAGGACAAPPAPPVTIAGKVELRVQLDDDDAKLKQVSWQLDGKKLAAVDKAPFAHTWDTAAHPDGEQKLSAVALTTKNESLPLSAAVSLNNCDVDTDGFAATACGGADCDDKDANHHPAAKDLLGDGVDQNCDGGDGIDKDGDGWHAPAAGGKDCNDSDKTIHPCVDDIAGDGIDQNCDGADVQHCDDCNVCTVDASAGKGCVHPAFNDGAKCEDGLPCTGGETCQKGKCVYANKKSCDDGNICTFDSCTAALGCEHKPKPGPCDDGSVCSTKDVCTAGACVGVKLKSCDDGKGCTTDTCDAKKGCSSVPAADGTPCVDGCAVGTCTAKKCVGKATALWSYKGDSGRAMRAVALAANSLLVVGWSKVSAAGGYAAWSGRFTSSGKLQSGQGHGDGALFDVAAIGDKYVAVGAAFSNYSEAPLVVVFDAAGKTKSSGGVSGSATRLLAIEPHASGGMFVGAASGAATSGNAVVMMLSASRSATWSKVVVTGSNGGVSGLTSAPDGDVVAATNSSTPAGFRAVVARYSPTGSQDWLVELAPPTSGNVAFVFLSGVARVGSSYFAGGAFGASNSQATRWLLALDGKGKTRWSRQHGAGAVWGVGADSSGLVAAGFNGSMATASAWFGRFDVHGNATWTRTGAGRAIVHPLVQPLGLVLPGDSGGAGGYAGSKWVARVDAFGHPTCSESGGCIAKSAKTCADANPCTADSCTPGGGCTHAPLADGAACGGAKKCSKGTCS